MFSYNVKAIIYLNLCENHLLMAVGPHAPKCELQLTDHI